MRYAPVRLLIACSLCLGVISAPAAAQTVDLKFAFFTSDTDRTWTTTILPFINAVNAEAKGTIRIQPFPNGALGRNLVQQSQMILDGVADLTFTLPSINAGRFPDNGAFELPGLFRDIREATLVITHSIGTGKFRGYEPYFVVGAFGGTPEGIHTSKPVASLADLVGKKIRGSSPLSANALRGLGAASLLLPTNEIAEAIARGTIDGTAMQPYPVVDFGIARVANNHYYATISTAMLAVLMNKSKFDNLPPAGQAAIRKYSGTWIGQRWIDGIGEANESATKQFHNDPKHKVVMPSDAEFASMDKVFAKVRGDWAAEAPRNAEMLEVVRAELTKLRSGK
jgi:TRAP-type C4-dicarboxylate transport system substrate-binding protein